MYIYIYVNFNLAQFYFSKVKWERVTKAVRGSLKTVAELRRESVLHVIPKLAV